MEKAEKSSGSNKPDIKQIMAEIRERVSKEVAEHGPADVEFRPKNLSANGQKTKAGQLVYSEDLRFLNLNHSIPQSPDLSHIVSHRAGILGKLIVKFKQKILNLIWNLFGEHFRKEQEFKAHLVRYLNDSSKYVDARDADNFWELIHKIDYDLNKALGRIDKIADQNIASLRSSEKQFGDDLRSNIERLQTLISKTQSKAESNQAQLESLDSVCRGLEGVVAKLSASSNDSTYSSDKKQKDKSPDYSYLMLENRFRGSEDEIAKRLEVYLPYFKTAKQDVLEIGSGRGELLELFNANSIPCRGIDIDAAMVEHCKEKDLKVELADAVSYLEGLKDNSLGGLIAVQVVEHLERDYLEKLFDLANQKVETGGAIIFETINPQSLLALSSNYFRDPTHVWPLHPDTLRYQAELRGLKVNEVKYLSPVQGLLSEVPEDEQMPPRWKNTITILNNNLKQLNNLLYGHMDYALIATPSK